MSSPLRREGDTKRATTVIAPIITPSSPPPPPDESTKKPSALSSAVPLLPETGATNDDDNSNNNTLLFENLVTGKGQKRRSPACRDQEHEGNDDDDLAIPEDEVHIRRKKIATTCDGCICQEEQCVKASDRSRFEFCQRPLSMGSSLSGADDGNMPALMKVARRSLPIFFGFSSSRTSCLEDSRTSGSRSDLDQVVTKLRRASDTKLYPLPWLDKQPPYQKISIDVQFSKGSPCQKTNTKSNNNCQLENFVEFSTSYSTSWDDDGISTSDDPRCFDTQKRRNETSGREEEEEENKGSREMQDIDRVLGKWNREEKKKSGDEMADVSSLQIPCRLTKLFPTSAHHQRNNCELEEQDDVDVEDCVPRETVCEDQDLVQLPPVKDDDDDDDDYANYKSLLEHQKYEIALNLLSLAMALPYHDEPSNAIIPALEVSDTEVHMDFLNTEASELNLQHEKITQPSIKEASEENVKIRDDQNVLFHDKEERIEGEWTAGGPGVFTLPPGTLPECETSSMGSSVATQCETPSLLANIKQENEVAVSVRVDNLREAHSAPSALLGLLAPQASSSPSCSSSSCCNDDYYTAHGMSQSTAAQICLEEPKSESIPSGSVYSESLSVSSSSFVPNTSGNLTKSCFLLDGVADSATATRRNPPAAPTCCVQKEEEEAIEGSQVLRYGSRGCADRMDTVTTDELISPSLPPSSSPCPSSRQWEQQQQQQRQSVQRQLQPASAYVKSRTGVSSPSKRDPYVEQAYESKIDSGAMNDVHDDVSSHESVKLENIHVRPESVQKMLVLQAEILREPDKYSDPNRFDAFDLVELDYVGMEKYLKFLVFYSLRRDQEDERRAKRKAERMESLTMSQPDDDHNMDPTRRAEPQKDNVENDEIRVTGLCVRIKNFFNLRRRLGQVSLGKFCWKQEEQQESSSLSFTHTTTTTSYELGSTTIASTVGNKTNSSYRRRKELQCEIEGRQVTDSDCSSSSRSYDVETTEFSKSTWYNNNISPTRGRKGVGISATEIPMKHVGNEKRDKKIKVELEASSESLRGKSGVTQPEALPLPLLWQTPTNLSFSFPPLVPSLLENAKCRPTIPDYCNLGSSREEEEEEEEEEEDEIAGVAVVVGEDKKHFSKSDTRKDEKYLKGGC